MEIYFVRFAKANEEFKGDESLLNDPLSNIGKEQARRTAKALKDKEISKFYCEENPASISTLEIILKERGKNEIFERLSNKMDFGELGDEGKADFFLKNIKKTDKNFLIVSTSDFISTLIVKLLDLPLSERDYFGIKNSSISWIRLGSNFEVEDFYINDFTHIVKESPFFPK